MTSLQTLDGRRRVVIENVQPEIDCGRFPIKRVIGERPIIAWEQSFKFVLC